MSTLRSYGAWSCSAIVTINIASLAGLFRITLRLPPVFHVMCGLLGGLAPQQFVNDVERSVNPCRDAGGGDDLAIVNKAAVLAHRRLRRFLPQGGDSAPVRRRFAPVKQAGFRQQERAGAD